MTTVNVLDPTNESLSEKSARAERLYTLEGATIGLIDNGKTNSDVVLRAIGQRLKDTSKVKNILYHRKPTSSHPIEKEEAEALAKQCDGIITGTGDWGSCSSGSLLDALVMEKLGIPAAAVLTEPFVPSGKAMALVQGFTDYPFAVITHPIGATEKQALEERADQVMEDVISLLLK